MQAVAASGTIAGVPIAAKLTIADSETVKNDPAVKSLVFAGEARDVVVADALKALFPSTPDLVLEILSPLRFDVIGFSWDGDFNISGSPDLSQVPGLSDLLDFLDFSQKDIKIQTAFSDGRPAIQIAIVKKWTLQLGSPFLGPSHLNFQLALSQDRANTQFMCQAAFGAGMRLPFLSPTDINFLLGAAVSYDTLAPPPGVSFILSAELSAMNDPVSLVGMPWVEVKYIGGSVGLTPMVSVPFVTIRSITFHGDVKVLGVEVTSEFFFNQPTAQFGVAFSIMNLDLQVGRAGG